MLSIRAFGSRDIVKVTDLFSFFNPIRSSLPPTADDLIVVFSFFDDGDLLHIIPMTGLSGLSHSSSLSSMLSFEIFMAVCVVQCNRVSYRKDDSSYKLTMYNHNCIFYYFNLDNCNKRITLATNSQCITTTAYFTISTWITVSVSETTSTIKAA